MLRWANSSSSCSIKLPSSSTDSATGSACGSWWFAVDVARRRACKLVPRRATRECEHGPAHSLELCDFISDKTSWKFADSEWLRPVDCNIITNNRTTWMDGWMDGWSGFYGIWSRQIAAISYTRFISKTNGMYKNLFMNIMKKIFQVRSCIEILATDIKIDTTDLYSFTVNKEL